VNSSSLSVGLNTATAGSKSGTATIALASDGTGGSLVYNGSSGTVHLILDVNGYFQ